MVKCKNPDCGIEIERPMKEWDMPPPRNGRNQNHKLHISHYACPKCGKTFRIAGKVPL
jgi:hypothetical protein